jgi:NDP-sugar pyrophosphorylase family protein
MQVVILAGGMGSRIEHIAPGTPKILLNVAGRPFVEHQFDLLRRAGLRHVLLCTGRGSGLIESHVSDGARFGMNVAYSRENPVQLLGTGGALVNALPLLHDRFLVMYGDAYLRIDYRKVAEHFERCGCDGLMCVFRNEGRWDNSNVRVHRDRVTFYSKSAPPGEADHIDYGLSAFHRHVMDRYTSSSLPFDLSRIHGDLIASGGLAAFTADARFYEIGRPEGLTELDSYLRGCAERQP